MTSSDGSGLWMKRHLLDSHCLSLIKRSKQHDDRLLEAENRNFIGMDWNIQGKKRIVIATKEFRQMDTNLVRCIKPKTSIEDILSVHCMGVHLC